MNKIRRAAALCAAALFVLAVGPPVEAAPVTSVALTKNTAASWDTKWNDNYEGQTVSATGSWSYLGTVGNLWSFTLNLVNTSSSPIGPTTFDPARLVSWGFNSTPTASNFDVTAPSTWNESGGQGVMTVDHCAYAGSNCVGGGNKGIKAPNGQLFAFTFQSAENSILLNNFLARFQSIGINSEGSTVLSAIPVPGAGMLLLGALASLGLVARRRIGTEA